MNMSAVVLCRKLGERLGTGGQRDDRQGCDNDDNVLFHIH